MGSGESGQTFNLSSLRSTDRSWKRNSLALYVGLACFLGLVGAYVLAQALEETGHGAVQAQIAVWSVAGLSVGVTAFVAVQVPGWLAGADNITIGGWGFELGYSGGMVERWRWADPQVRFIVFEYAPGSDWDRIGAHYRLDRPRKLSALGLDHRRSFLTEVAARTLLAEARAHGMKVTATSGSAFLSGADTKIYQLSARLA